MKKLITILILITSFCHSYSQDVVGSRVIAKQSLFVRDRWVDTVKNDTTNLLNSVRSLMTANAIYEFVNARMSGGGGGSGTVTSVAMSVPSFLSVSGSPITTSGTLAVTLSGTALPAANGGTGQTSYVVGDLLTANTTTTLSTIAASTSGFVLTSNGAGVAPTWQAIPSDNLIVQNAGSGTQTWFTSGDTLYMKMVKNTTFISASTDTDSSLLISLSATGTPSSSTALFGDNTWKAAMTNPMTTAGDLITGGASGVPSRVALGSALQVLRVNAGGTAVEWAASAGGGDVSKVGTPVNNQLGVWTGDGTIEGDANLTFASSTLNIGVAGSATGILTMAGVTSGVVTIQPASAAGTYTLTWPTTDGNSGEFLQTNGSGVLTWAAGGGGVAWGAITGTLSDQTDLQSALDLKLNITTSSPAHTGITPTGTGIIPVWYPVRLTSDFTLANSASAQNAFPSTIDVWTLQGNTTYYFKGVYFITSGNASHTLGISFALGGGASLTRISYNFMGRQTTAAAGTVLNGVSVLATNTVVTTAATSGNHSVAFEGWLTVNAGGTVTPQITFSADPTGTILMKTDSWIMFIPVGDGSFESAAPVN